MEQQTVFVVLEWRDYRKENHAEVLSVHLNKENAYQALEKAILDYNSDNLYEIERFENGANVIDGEDYEVFEVVEKKLLP